MSSRIEEIVDTRTAFNPRRTAFVWNVHENPPHNCLSVWINGKDLIMTLL
jgi:hypothetical protein